MQCTVGGPFHSLWRTSRIVYEERDRSFRKMFYGVHVNYTRALISWGIINASYELLRSFLDHRPYIHWCYFFRSIIINLFLIIRSGEIAFVLLSGVAEKKICGHLSTFFWFQKPSTFFFIVKLHHYIVLLKDGEIKFINFSSDLFFVHLNREFCFQTFFYSLHPWLQGVQVRVWYTTEIHQQSICNVNGSISSLVHNDVDHWTFIVTTILHPYDNYPVVNDPFSKCTRVNRKKLYHRNLYCFLDF